MISLTHHMLQRQQLHAEPTAALSVMMTQMALCGKLIARDVNRAGLLGTFGTTGTTNVHGEQVQNWMNARIRPLWTCLQRATWCVS